MSKRVFLTAEWRKLIMANYIVDPTILQPYVPANTTLDYWNGHCYVSLVGFMFKEVTVKGLKIPFHVNFPEVNLRFYVRHKEGNEWKRGVVFISEIVPKPAIVFVANTLFKEHYKTMPMKYNWEITGDKQLIEYQWKYREHWNVIKYTTNEKAIPLANNSEAEFITEHFWGYSNKGNRKTVEYHVQHPRWDVYPVSDYEIQCDFKSLYGRSFAHLADRTPDSIFMAEGSPIKIFNKKVL